MTPARSCKREAARSVTARVAALRASPRKAPRFSFASRWRLLFSGVVGIGLSPAALAGASFFTRLQFRIEIDTGRQRTRRGATAVAGWSLAMLAPARPLAPVDEDKPGDDESRRGREA